MSCRIAIVGLGKIAADQHLPAIAADPRFTLAATVDARRPGVGAPHFDSLDALLASGTALDAVALCTPPQARDALALRAIDAGLAVLLEKPPASSVAALEALRWRAAHRRVSLFAAWHSRFAPMVPRARDWLAGRTVAGGAIRWREDVRHWHPGQAWLWQPGGLGVFDPGINAFSILTALLPNAPRVAQAALDVPRNAATPVAARLALHAGAATITAELDFLESRRQEWTLHLDATDGHALTLLDGGAALSLDGAEPERAQGTEYPALYAHFAELIASRTSDADGAPLALVEAALDCGLVRPVADFLD